MGPRGLRGLFDRRGAGLGVELCARDRGGGIRGLDVGLSLGQPCIELGRRHGADLGDHGGVQAPAQLGALAGVDARLVDLEPGVVVIAGHGVELAAELGDPP
jgi:hypothetical protein